jgi:hypothetical protein
LEKLVDKICGMFKISDSYIFNMNNQMKGMWDILIMMFALINCFFLPMQYSFELNTFFESQGFLALSYVIDIVFIIDIVLIYFTPFINIRGAEVRTSHLIAKNYMTKVEFYTDLASVFGSSFFPSKSLGFFRFFKMLRVRRISKYIASLNVRKNIKVTC